MDFLKKHFEKVFLSLVLLGLAGAAAYLPIKITQNQDEISTALAPITIAPKPYKGENITKYTDLIAKKRADVKLSSPHNLVNPVPWKRTPDNRIIKVRTGEEIGLGALRITKLEPLNLSLTLENVSGKSDSLRYGVGMVREADPKRDLRRKVVRQYSVGSSSRGDLFILQEVQGPPDNPTAVVLEMIDTKERITLTKEKEYKRVDGYRAEFRYDPENKNFPSRRQKSQSTDAAEHQIEFGNEKYNIVAITDNEVTVSAVSTSKRTAIEFKSANVTR